MKKPTDSGGNKEAWPSSNKLLTKTDGGADSAKRPRLPSPGSWTNEPGAGDKCGYVIPSHRNKMFTQRPREGSAVDLKILAVNFAVFTDSGAEALYLFITSFTQTTFMVVPLEFHLLYVLDLYLDYSAFG